MPHITAMPDRYGGDRNFVCCAQLQDRILTFFVVGFIVDWPSPEIRHGSGSCQGLSLSFSSKSISQIQQATLSVFPSFDLSPQKY